eukprot:m.125373 g.125373  ORF g.125373 m.125373 type:complete len:304 (+) comp9376_c1_seq1:282-1193(+)
MLAHALVRGHLGVCLNVSADRECIQMTYASEPVVAAGAAAIMNALAREGPGFERVLDELVSAMNTGDINVGAAGELVARIILLRAMDTAREKAEVKVWQRVTLPNFLETLLGPNHGIKLPPRLQTAMVNFTHFVPAAFTPSSRDAFRAAYNRGAAYVCRPNQAGVDILIFIEVLEPDKPPSVECILVQVKNRVAMKGSSYSDPTRKLDVPYALRALAKADADFVKVEHVGLFLNVGWVPRKPETACQELLPVVERGAMTRMMSAAGAEDHAYVPRPPCTRRAPSVASSSARRSSASAQRRTHS